MLVSFFFETSTLCLTDDSTNLIFWCFIRKIWYLQKKCNFWLEIELIFFYFTKICLTKPGSNLFFFLLRSFKKPKKWNFIIRKVNKSWNFSFFYAKQLLVTILQQSEHAYLLIWYTIMMKHIMFNFCVYMVYN